jgi:hypothetical protein
MTIVLISLFATTLGERSATWVGRRSFIRLLLIGVLSVVHGHCKRAAYWP